MVPVAVGDGVKVVDRLLGSVKVPVPMGEVHIPLPFAFARTAISSVPHVSYGPPASAIADAVIEMIALSSAAAQGPPGPSGSMVIQVMVISEFSSPTPGV